MKTLSAIDKAIKQGRTFVIIVDMGGGKIQISGPADREWLVETLTAVLAGATHKPTEELLEKVVTVGDYKHN